MPEAASNDFIYWVFYSYGEYKSLGRWGEYPKYMILSLPVGFALVVIGIVMKLVRMRRR